VEGAKIRQRLLYKNVQNTESNYVFQKPISMVPQKLIEAKIKKNKKISKNKNLDLSKKITNQTRSALVSQKNGKKFILNVIIIPFFELDNCNKVHNEKRYKHVFVLYGHMMVY
jgi:hypothetical protein